MTNQSVNPDGTKTEKDKGKKRKTRKPTRFLVSLAATSDFHYQLAPFNDSLSASISTRSQTRPRSKTNEKKEKSEYRK